MIQWNSIKNYFKFNNIYIMKIDSFWIDQADYNYDIFKAFQLIRSYKCYQEKFMNF